MTANAQAATGEAAIRALIEGRVPALASKTLAALTSHYADDVVVFDAVGPLRASGADAHTRRVTEWLAAYRGPIRYQIRDLDITAGEQVAFCHYLYRVAGTMTDGTRVGMWLRSTVCLRRIGRDWTITHEHTSVPFDGQTGAAALDAQP
jgi:ketosteroid isomerase-like protein